MTERDEYTAEGLLPNLAGHKALQIKKLEERARLAEQREAELVKLLEIAQCPQCNGSGVVQEGNGSIYKCQWHHERKALLAKHKAEGTEET